MQFDGIKTLIDLSGGINSDASSYNIKDNEILDTSRNVRVDPIGPISGRYGNTRIGPLTSYANPGGGSFTDQILSLHRFYKTDGNHRMLFNAGAYLLKVDLAFPLVAVNIPPKGGAASAPAFTDSSGQTDVGVYWEFSTHLDWSYFTSGLARPRRTDGNYVYYVGEPGDTASGAVAPIAGGSLPVGTYYYRFTRVYGNLGESPMGAQGSATTGGGNLQIQVTVPVFAGDVTAIRVYRSYINSPNGPYYLVAERSVAGAFTDNTQDVSLGVRLDTTRIQPPFCAWHTFHHDRLFLAKVTETAGANPRFYVDVLLSDANAPEQFRAQNRLRMPNPKGEAITGITSFNGMVLIFTMNQIYAIVGSGIERGPQLDIPDYQIIKLVKGPGAMSQRCIQELKGALYFMNKGDVWRMVGTEIQSLSEFRVANFIRDNVNAAYCRRACGIATKDQYRVTFPQQGSVLPDLTLIYDIQANAFLVDEGYMVNDYEFIAGDEDTPTLYAAHALTSVANILKMDDEATSPQGDWRQEGLYNTIDRRFRTKDFSLGAINQPVQYRQLYLEGIATDSTIIMLGHLNKDKTTLAIAAFSMSNNAPVWGGFVWGAAKWGSLGQVLKTISMKQQALSERISLEIYQQEQTDPFQIEMLGIGYIKKQPRHTTLGGT